MEIYFSYEYAGSSQKLEFTQSATAPEGISVGGIGCEWQVSSYFWNA